MFDFLRLYLFLGMVVHKLVWEALKQKQPSSRSIKVQEKPLVRLIKVGKVVFLIFLMLQTLILPTVLPISSNPENLRLYGTIIYTLGLVIAIIGRVQLGKNWANIEDYQVLSNQKMVDSGLYRYIRHPIYTGDILLILGLELALNSWLVLIVIPLIFLISRQARAEELILAQAFPDYSIYKNRTRMFIPFVV